MNRKILIGMSIALMGVSACDNGATPSPAPSPTPTPSPTPAPTPSPTPSPTPAPTYATFPLTTDTEFPAMSARLNYYVDETPPTEATSAAVRFQLPASTDPVAGSHYFRFTRPETGTLETFIKTNYIRTTVDTYTLTATDSPGSCAFPLSECTLTVLNNTVASHVSSNPDFALRYTTYVGLYAKHISPARRDTLWAIGGYPTLGTDIPTTGVVHYRVVVDATGFVPATRAEGRLTGTATVRVDFATRNVTLSGFRLDGPNSAAFYALLNGTGTWTAGTNAIAGTLTGQNGATGSFKAQLFGPQGAEFGLVFGFTGGILGYSRTAGLMAGKKY